MAPRIGCQQAYPPKHPEAMQIAAASTARMRGADAFASQGRCCLGWFVSTCRRGVCSRAQPAGIALPPWIGNEEAWSVDMSISSVGFKEENVISLRTQTSAILRLRSQSLFAPSRSEPRQSAASPPIV